MAYFANGNGLVHLHQSQKIHIGDVSVHRGMPRNKNPYLDGGGLLGEERVEALRLLKQDEATGEHTYWYAPSCGGARRITSASEIDWESSGV